MSLQLIAMLPLIGSLLSFFSVKRTNIQNKAIKTTLLILAVYIVAWCEYNSIAQVYQGSGCLGWKGSWSSYQSELAGTSLTNQQVGSLPFSVVDATIYNTTRQELLLNNKDTLDLGIDGISLLFVMLTALTLPLCLMSSLVNVKKKIFFFLINLLVLESFLIMVFVVVDIIIFYIFFESVLIPLFLLVGIWGSSKLEPRIRASYLLFLYTLFGSLFILLGFLYLCNISFSSDLTFLEILEQNYSYEYLVWLCVFLSFSVKQPMVPFHIWLNRAHAEAPVSGSIILAGLILKLATYGVLRILLSLLPDGSIYFTGMVLIFSIFTLIYSSLTTLRQIDIKILIAYSSVGHIALVVVGLFSNNIQAIGGAILLSFGHGLVSPALFFIVGGVIYDRFHQRTITYYRGLIENMPIISFIFFLFMLGNMGVPLTINWLGEFFSLLGAFIYSILGGFLMAFSILLSAAYSIWMWARISGGFLSKYIVAFSFDLVRREFHLLFVLLILTFLGGIFPNILLDDITNSLAALN